MAASDTVSDRDIARAVLDTPVVDEMRESFLAYSLSVITSRAIPDVRDGLKPVQRRILYSMLELGMRPTSPHKKCSRVVGNVMSNYHPHGDQAIYEALVRLGQDFSLRLPLVDPKGNFGSPDDPPAASRYTECRMAEAAMAMVGELDEETVEFRPNYDGESIEPDCLPARFPNLLVNGASGIAVGMATNLAPHNLGEVCAALRLMLTDPEVSLRRVMGKLRGPDLPTGGTIIDDGGLATAYETGRGTFRIRATAKVVDVTARKRGIVVTELPYAVGIERVVAKISELMRADKLSGITDIKDLSDRHHGLRLQIECRSGVDPAAVLAELYRLTPLEESFGINNVVLVDGRPTTLGLLDLMRHYLEHRLDVVVRRSEHRLAKARARAHIVEGLLIALDNIDEVIRIIRSSADTATARGALIEAFDLSEEQATHILDMPLRRLTALEVSKLREELAELAARIADLEDILANEARRRDIVAEELAEVADEFGDKRRSAIVSADEAVLDAPSSLEIADDPCQITLSTSGVVGRMAEGADFGAKPGRHDLLLGSAPTTARGRVWAVTTTGRLLALDAVEVPEVAGRSRGAPAGELFDLARGERLVGLFGASDASDERRMVLVTRQGVIKRLTGEELAASRPGAEVIALKGSDRVVAAFAAPDGIEVAMVASDGQVLRTAIDQVRPQGRSAGGMAGMKLKGEASVVFAGPLDDTDVVVTVTDTGALAVVPAEEFSAKGRATGGVRALRMRAGDAGVAAAWVGPMEQAACLVGEGEGLFAKPSGGPVPLPVGANRRDAAPTVTASPVLVVGRAR